MSVRVPFDTLKEMADHRVAAADSAHPIDPEHPVRCPGESTVLRREKSMAEGVNVDEKILAQIQALAAVDMNVRDLSGR